MIMANMSTSESNTYLAHLLAEMLGLTHLPSDLHQALSDHLNKQLNQVNILKPEYCRRLYPILAELAAESTSHEPIEKVESSREAVRVETNELHASEIAIEHNV
jgi:hypothetical protein